MHMRNLSIALLICCAAPLFAQEPPEVDPNLAGGMDKNVKLRLQLDRVEIRTYEPVYLSVSAARFADNLAPDIRVREKGQPMLDLGDMEGQWLTTSDPKETPKRMRLLLIDASNGTTSRYLFSQAGEYELRVKIGPDYTNLTVTVEQGSDDDDKAFGELGPDNFNAILTEAFNSVPPPALIKTAETVARNHPDSLAATYCRGYLATAAFKDAARIYHFSGGKPVWGPIAEELLASFKLHNGDCYGEELGYYTAHAQGLSGDFAAAIQTINTVKTHLTPWSDQMARMKADIAAHVRPVEVKPAVR
jgi:hypothetical protein